MKSDTPATSAVRKHESALRDFAMSLPEATEDFPWGHRAIKVKKKVFVFMCADGNGLSLSAKLPLSRDAALDLPFAEPTHYGLGKSGWVTASFEPGDKPPIEVLRAWIDESYRAIAPKKLAASLAGGAVSAAVAPKSKPRAAKAAKAKTAKTKSAKSKPKARSRAK